MKTRCGKQDVDFCLVGRKDSGAACGVFQPRGFCFSALSRTINGAFRAASFLLF